jgi:hypothetical protein
MKKSKLQRKFVNQMRDMGDVPWPARRFKYPATHSVVGAAKETHLGSCKRPVGETKVRVKRLRRRQTAEILCGGRVFLKRGSLGKRRVYCESCRARKRQRRLELRIAQRLQSRFGISPREQAREERRSTRMLSRFRRSGVR